MLNGKNISKYVGLAYFRRYTYPFDRHDWIIDRCGKEVRYIIDFYSGKPDSKNPHSVSFYIDARPALTLEGVVDRIRMIFAS